MEFNIEQPLRVVSCLEYHEVPPGELVVMCNGVHRVADGPRIYRVDGVPVTEAEFDTIRRGPYGA